MEAKIDNVQPVVAEGWINSQNGQEAPPRVKPVEKQEETSLRNQEERERSEAKAQAEAKNMGATDVKELVEEAQSYIEDLNIRLNFKVDGDSGNVVVRVLNRETEELIRQIPSEELVNLREKLVELRGVLLDDKA